MNLVLHDAVETSVQSYLGSPSHALVIAGPLGAGKPSLAKDIAAKLLGSNLDNYPYFSHIKPEDGFISIDTIHHLKNFMSLRTTGTNPIRRAAIIEDADTMTVQAQNALLKILEEPPDDTALILTVSQPSKILPTIYSRCQKLTVRPPQKASALDRFKETAAVDARRAYSLSGGNMGLMHALLDTETEHPLKEDVELAKSLLSSSQFERLVRADALSKDKSSLPGLLYALERIFRALLEQAAAKSNTAEIKRAHAALQTIQESREMLERNASPKLLMTNLLMNL